jgi:hypothetical protein
MDFPTQQRGSTYQVNGLGQVSYQEPFESMQRSFDSMVQSYGTMTNVADAYRRASKYQLWGALAGAALSLGLGTMKGYNKNYWAMLPVFPVLGALGGRAIGFRMAKQPNGNGNGATAAANGGMQPAANGNGSPNGTLI